MTHNWVWKILLELFIEAKDQDQSCVLVDGPSMTAKEVLFSKPYRPAGLQAEIDKAVAKAIGESEWGSHHGKGQDGGSLKMRCEKHALKMWGILGIKEQQLEAAKAGMTRI